MTGATPVNLAKVRDAQARIEAVLREHPEVAERTAEFFAGDPSLALLEESMALERPVKLPVELLDRAGVLVAAMEAREEYRLLGLSKAGVVRLALARGLALLEAEFLESTPPVIEVESIDGRKVASKPEPRPAPTEPLSYTRAPGAPPETAPTVRSGAPRKRAPKTAPPMTGPAAELRQWRKEQGHTQGQAAALLGLTQATWSRWERNETPPTAEDAAKLEEISGIPAASWGE